MTDTTARRLAWGLAMFAVAESVAVIVLTIVNIPLLRSVNDLSIIETIAPLTFGLIGGLIASRQRRNPIGWIFLAIATLGGIPGVVFQYALHGARTGVRPPLIEWAAWLQNWVTVPIFPAGLVSFFILLFPNGRLPSRRWRIVIAFGTTITAFVTLLVALEPTISIGDTLKGYRNPLPVSSFPRLEDTALGAALYLVSLVVLPAAAAGAVVRFRRARGVERQQLKLFVFAVASTVAVLVVTAVVVVAGRQLPDVVYSLEIAGGLGVAIPVACGVAILRYGLYEIDVVINRTVMYGALAVVITGVYLAVVVGIGAAIGSASNPVLTLIAAVIVAFTFQPLRDRARRLANRLVYGERATPYEVLSNFADRVAATYGGDDVLARMAQVVRDGTGAERADVWLRIGADLRPAASSPQDAPAPIALRMGGGELPQAEGVDAMYPVRDRGEVLGALSIVKRKGDPLTPAEDKLVSDLASQAGLVLRNVRLIEDLRASRQRIVAAQDEERRKLERNIHDGAQQQLVAIAVKLRLLEALTSKDPDKAAELARQIGAETTDALENLRDLARGIYPPLLADQGLAAALESQARKSAVPVEVHPDGVGRCPQEVEAAVYFSVLEALQNVAKYADATHAAVELRAQNGVLTFEVRDDGRGFDASTTTYGTGLQGMADRLAAVGGDVAVQSTPGSGTTVTGSVPVHPEEPR